MTLLLAAVGASLLPNYDYNPAVIGLAPASFAELGITLKSAYDLDVPNGFLPAFGSAEGMVRHHRPSQGQLWRFRLVPEADVVQRLISFCSP